MSQQLDPHLGEVRPARRIVMLALVIQPIDDGPVHHGDKFCRVCDDRELMQRLMEAVELACGPGERVSAVLVTKKGIEE